MEVEVDVEVDPMPLVAVVATDCLSSISVSTFAAEFS